MYSYVLNIPTELQEKILSYMNFDEIARLRLVCNTFNFICQRLLNKGFTDVERFHGSCLRTVKSQLPRRESERRNHSLARHCDILNSIETRLSLLNMTFIKYVELNLCCFIPGKVVDEIYRVLRIIRQTKSAPRAHEILQELRDISSMAMEHFDEKIVPTLKPKMIALVPSAIEGAMVMARNTREVPMTRALRLELIKIQHTCKLQTCEVRIKVLGLEKKFLEMNHVINDQNAKIVEQEGRINEMNRKLIEYDRRFAQLIGQDVTSIVGTSASTTASAATASTSTAITKATRTRNKVATSINVYSIDPAEEVSIGPMTRSKRLRLSSKGVPEVPPSKKVYKKRFKTDH